MINDLISNLKITQITDSANFTASSNCGSVDRKGYEALVFVVLVGQSGDDLSGSKKIELEVEESDDNASFTDVPDAQLSSYVDGVNDGCFAVINSPSKDETVYTVQYKGAKRFVRTRLAMSGMHINGTPIGVVAIQGYPQYAPV